jgi:hypothetical protein
VTGEPLSGQPVDHLRQRRGTGCVKVVAGAGDDREDFGQGGAIGELGIHPHRDLDQRVGHQAHPASKRSCGSSCG